MSIFKVSLHRHELCKFAQQRDLFIPFPHKHLKYSSRIINPQAVHRQKRNFIGYLSLANVYFKSASSMNSVFLCSILCLFSQYHLLMAINICLWAKTIYPLKIRFMVLGCWLMRPNNIRKFINHCKIAEPLICKMMNYILYCSFLRKYNRR